MLCFSVNPVQDGRGGGAQKVPPASFSPVTSTNVGTDPQNLLTFSFNPFATLVKNFKPLPSVSPKLLNLNQGHPSNSYEIEIMITSLIEMLKLSNFDHMITSTI